MAQSLNFIKTLRPLRKLKLGGGSEYKSRKKMQGNTRDWFLHNYHGIPLKSILKFGGVL